MKSAVPVHKVLRLPRALQLKVLKALRAKCRSCHETCYWRCSKCCACHKFALPTHKVPLLPRNLLLEVLKVLMRLPRNLQFQQSAAPATKSATGGAQSADSPRHLQFQCTKCCSCHEICYWRCSKCCARHEICTSRFTSRSAAKAVGSGRRSSL